MSIGKNSSISLVGIDGVGGDHKLHKAMDYSLSAFSFFDDVILLTCDDIDTGIQIPSMTSMECQKFTINNLNDHVETDYMLIVQGDGFIVNPDAWDDEFLDYDYIGAPWCLPWRWTDPDPHLTYAKN